MLACLTLDYKIHPMYSNSIRPNLDLIRLFYIFIHLTISQNSQ